MAAIKLYTWDRPNGYKVAIALEELGLEYEPVLIDLEAGQQFDAAFARISPNSKIPAIHDPEGPEGPITLFESGLILEYLADKVGRLLPKSGQQRYEVLQWVFWQVGGPGPWFGLYFLFRDMAEAGSPIVARLQQDVVKRLEVLDRRLQESTWLAGNEYSIADISSYVVAKRALMNLAPEGLLPPLPHLSAWLDRLGERPAVQRGLKVPLPIDWRTTKGLRSTD